MVGTAIGAAVSLGGSLLGSKASKSAAKTQAASADAATQAQLDMFNQVQENQKPWLNTGKSALSRLSFLMGLPEDTASENAIDPEEAIDTSADTWRPNSELYANDPAYKAEWDRLAAEHRARFGTDPAMSKGSTLAAWLNPLKPFVDAYNKKKSEEAKAAQGPVDPEFGSLAKPFGMEDFTKDPGYDFRLLEGQKALERSASARGGLLSGSAFKAITRYGQDYGSSEYQKAYDRYNTNQTNLFNRLSGIAGTGQTASNTVSQAGLYTGNQMADNMMGAGNARAAGEIGSANAWSTGLNNIAKNFTFPSQKLYQGFGDDADYRYV